MRIRLHSFRPLTAWEAFISFIKSRLNAMLGLTCFRNAAVTISGIELMHRIRKAQFDLTNLRLKDTNAPAIWNAVLSAR
ncbi:hypothetical protein BN2475_820006 [Paraburkholderia ribeironis]|uniref:DDE domain-containing protein n=1 Tax=Paraburkholderia ribeironis TaxID=1247936 RepID=A0A1N7SLF3_9BURK|nr:hypothetical protein BN2475_820006 [Paraburkholderia ribeironis]